MPLDDVWHDFSKSTRIFWSGQFDKIPQQPGVYAWFYPLKVTKKDLHEQIAEFNTVHLFHPQTEGPPKYAFEQLFHWDKVRVELTVERGDSFAPQTRHEAAWKRLHKDKAALRRFREIMLRASLSTPPLYVGKAKNLYVRCHDHLNESRKSKSSFGDRYTKFAEKMDLSWKSVEELILVVNVIDESQPDIPEVEDLLEAIVMAASRPPYGQQL